MPTLRVTFLEPNDGTGVDGAWLVSIATDETLQKVLERTDPSLTPTPGNATALQAGPVVTVVTRAFGATDRLRGFIATSDRAVRWSLKVNGVEKLAIRTETGAPALHVPLPGSIVSGAVTVRLDALNESDQGDAACDASLLWYTPT